MAIENKYHTIWIVEDNKSLTFFGTGQKEDMVKRSSYLQTEHIITDENGDVVDIKSYKDDTNSNVVEILREKEDESVTKTVVNFSVLQDLQRVVDTVKDIYLGEVCGDDDEVEAETVMLSEELGRELYLCLVENVGSLIFVFEYIEDSLENTLKIDSLNWLNLTSNEDMRINAQRVFIAIQTEIILHLSAVSVE